MKVKLYSNKKKLELPIYDLSLKSSYLNQKSCFIDHNRIDTVKLASKNKSKE